jgi:hypothetical protein
MFRLTGDVTQATLYIRHSASGVEERCWLLIVTAQACALPCPALQSVISLPSPHFAVIRWRCSTTPPSSKQKMDTLSFEANLLYVGIDLPGQQDTGATEWSTVGNRCYGSEPLLQANRMGTVSIICAGVHRRQPD